MKASASAKSLVPRADAPSASLALAEFLYRVSAENPVEEEGKRGGEAEKRKDNDSSESMRKGASLRKSKEASQADSSFHLWFSGTTDDSKPKGKTEMSQPIFF